MKLTFDNEYSIFNQDNVLVAGIGTTIDITRVALMGDTVVFEATQQGDEGAALLPKNTIITIKFNHAKIVNLSTYLKSRSLDEIKVIEVIAESGFTAEHKAAGYNHRIELYDDADHTWELLYKDSQVSYRLPG